MDCHGWVEVRALIKGVKEKKDRKFNRAELETIVKTDEKGRFVFSPDGNRIKACQGHSIPWVEPEVVRCEPPRYLYHGTTTKAWSKILADGAISKMDRHAVHMQAERSKAWQSAKRWKLIPILLQIDAKRLYEEGFLLGWVENGVWCASSVPVDYVINTIVEKTKKAA